MKDKKDLYLHVTVGVKEVGYGGVPHKKNCENTSHLLKDIAQNAPIPAALLGLISRKVTLNQLCRYRQMENNCWIHACVIHKIFDRAMKMKHFKKTEKKENSRLVLFTIF